MRHIEEAWDATCPPNENKKIHKMVRGKSGRLWVYEPGTTNIYLEDPNGKGFGGKDITLTLVDGNTVTLTGPWMSNVYSMVTDTNVDPREERS